MSTSYGEFKFTVRSYTAILWGFVIIMVLSMVADGIVRVAIPGAFDVEGRVTSPAVLSLTLVYVAVFAVFGCYICARRAPNRPMLHAITLGLVGLALNVGAAIVLWDTAPAWYHIVSLAMVLPYAWAGGRIREIEIERGGGAHAHLAAE